jgi:hypothetical protein
MYKIRYFTGDKPPTPNQFKSPAQAESVIFATLGKSGVVAERKDDRTRPRQYLRAGVLVAEVLAC